MSKPTHAPSPLRIFAFSAIASLAILVGVLFGLGGQALFVTAVLAIIEITFSFDNAIINAKVLNKLSHGWQVVFLTAGIVIAIFGMRILFPIAIVDLTAHLGWRDVVNLALHHPKEYAHHLEQAHTTIASFGGGFLLLLALSFFMSRAKEVHWLRPERVVARYSHWSLAAVVAIAVVLVIAFAAGDSDRAKVLTAGLLGILTYIAIQLLDALFERLREGSARRGAGTSTTMAALASLLYLEILDASFSFDGVIGAFAITSDVVLIAAGLGIGALWVRSLTVYMVRHELLGRYRYIEHGAHYTVLALALVLLLSVIWNISDFIPGIAGLAIIGASIAASVQAERAEKK